MHGRELKLDLPADPWLVVRGDDAHAGGLTVVDAPTGVGSPDQRRRVAKRGENVAERVAKARGRMQVHKGGVARALRIAIGHGDDHRFL